MRSSRLPEQQPSPGLAHSSLARCENGSASHSAAACPGVSVVICSYSEKRWPMLLGAVGSVLAQGHVPVEVILVVDHNEALLERVRQEWPEANVVASVGAPGLAAARNTGVRLARGEIIAFLDDDARAEPDWLTQLVAAYEDPVVMAAGGSIAPLWPRERPWWFPREFDWVVGCSYQGLPLEDADVRNVIGANMSFRREVLHSIGGFRDELGRTGTFPIGCEETELCIRAGMHMPDRVIRYTPAAHVDHHVSDERTRWRYYLSRCFQEGRSKSIVASLTSSRRGLATERSYVVSTLPRGIGRGLADVFVRRDLGGCGRAFAIILGLGTTSAGYAFGRFRIARRRLLRCNVEKAPA